MRNPTEQNLNWLELPDQIWAVISRELPSLGKGNEGLFLLCKRMAELFKGEEFQGLQLIYTLDKIYLKDLLARVDAEKQCFYPSDLSIPLSDSFVNILNTLRYEARNKPEHLSLSAAKKMMQRYKEDIDLYKTLTGLLAVLYTALGHCDYRKELQIINNKNNKPPLASFNVAMVCVMLASISIELFYALQWKMNHTTFFVRILIILNAMLNLLLPLTCLSFGTNCGLSQGMEEYTLAIQEHYAPIKTDLFRLLNFYETLLATAQRIPLEIYEDEKAMLPNTFYLAKEEETAFFKIYYCVWDKNFVKQRQEGIIDEELQNELQGLAAFAPKALKEWPENDPQCLFQFQQRLNREEALTEVVSGLYKYKNSEKIHKLFFKPSLVFNNSFILQTIHNVLSNTLNIYPASLFALIKNVIKERPKTNRFFTKKDPAEALCWLLDKDFDLLKNEDQKNFIKHVEKMQQQYRRGENEDIELLTYHSLS